jgi:crotonobetainyl-CoA:carnitine CoA-transferase CaiB-like acyl-CoA transferase
MTTNIPPRGPLDGICVVDFSANMSGPFATMILGDQGADVIKVEAIKGGDTLRNVGTKVGNFSTYFANLNRSKRSLALDLTNPQARPVVDALLDRADVVIHNLRASVAKRLEIDASRVREGRPRLIYLSIGGFGAEGPYGGRPAYDHVIQALSGFASRQADPATNEPSLLRQGAIDKATGLTAAQAITAALFERSKTGEGQVIEVNMLDVAVSFLWPDGMMNHTLVEPEGQPAPDIARSFRLSPTSDGHVAFALVHDRQWAKLTESVGPWPSGEGTRVASRADVMREVGRRLAELSTVEAVSFLASQDIPVAEVVPLEGVAHHPQVIANDTLDLFDHPVLGRIRQPNPPVRFANRRANQMLPAPSLGQDDREVLSELGFGENAIEGLLRSGVVGDQSTSTVDQVKEVDGAS